MKFLVSLILFVSVVFFKNCGISGPEPNPVTEFTIKFSDIKNYNGDVVVEHYKDGGRGTYGNPSEYNKDLQELTIYVFYTDLNPCKFIVNFYGLSAVYIVEATYNKKNNHFVITKVMLDGVELTLVDGVFQ